MERPDVALVMIVIWRVAENAKLAEGDNPVTIGCDVARCKYLPPPPTGLTTWAAGSSCAAIHR